MLKKGPILDLLQKDFKKTILNILKELKKTKSMMYEWIENINEEIEIMKRSKAKILELKHALIKNSSMQKWVI